MNYQTKPRPVDAHQFTQADLEAQVFERVPLPHGLRLASAGSHPVRRQINSYTVWIETEEGKLKANVGDWVVTDRFGGVRLFSDGLFKETFEPTPTPERL